MNAACKCRNWRPSPRTLFRPDPIYRLCLMLLAGLFLSGCGADNKKTVDPFRATRVAEAMAKSNTIQNLDLYYRRLNGFPLETLTLKTLKQLNLRTCKIGQLPDGITTLTQLTRLDLGQTSLTNLTPAVGQLTHLTHLWLNDNPLPTLPREMGRLSQLTYLNVDRTRLTEIPLELGLLANLKWLRLNHNQLTALPADMSGLAKNLKVLYLVGNPIPVAEQERIKESLPGCDVIFHTDQALKQ